MILNNFFEKIYVISLLSATQRRKSVDSLSKIYEFNFQYIDAVDKSTIDMGGLKKEKKWAYPQNDFYCSKKCSCKGLGHELNTSQIGCQLSHEIAWKDMIKKGFQECFRVLKPNGTLIFKWNECRIPIKEIKGNIKA